MLSVAGPIAGSGGSLAYDGFGRVRTTTDSEGYAVTKDYDAIDRLTKVTFPDATYIQKNYTKLDCEWQRDRLGRWSYTFHDALRRVALTQDPAGRRVKYTWCMCGALDKITDGENHTTGFSYDLEHRVIQKTFADNTATQFTYDPYRENRLHGLNEGGRCPYRIAFPTLQ